MIFREIRVLKVPLVNAKCRIRAWRVLLALTKMRLFWRNKTKSSSKSRKKFSWAEMLASVGSTPLALIQALGVTHLMG